MITVKALSVPLTPDPSPQWTITISSQHSEALPLGPHWLCRVTAFAVPKAVAG